MVAGPQHSCSEISLYKQPVAQGSGGLARPEPASTPIAEGPGLLSPSLDGEAAGKAVRAALVKDISAALQAYRDGEGLVIPAAMHIVIART